MFPGVITPQKEALVQAGLPSLLDAMELAQINTARRVAAFLATIRAESRFEYNIPQTGATGQYKGRGYIQLTGLTNYTEAGKYLGIDLVNNPELALSLEWSAPIARWYWTVARHINPLADQLLMGKVNRAIGYPRAADGSNDDKRCADFAAALNYLTGSVPAGISCVR